MAIDVEAHYRRYGPLVLRRCRRLLRDEQRALDATQDVFVELLRREASLRDTAPSALLQRIATNLCLNRLRSERRRPEDRDEELLLRIASSAEGADRRAETLSVLARIFGRERESTAAIAVMHLVDGLTLEEVAAEVQMSVSGVRKRLRTLRARVHELEGV
ncbi:MAG TPA: sigma-70 family RNA polymerase sigma factor [Myxococcales bacterium]|nr:sigma-70 family RNA polymerase sigma factor [Myxococcales bacterium]